MEIPREAREVVVFRLDLLWAKGGQFALDIECSKGTYIRSLVTDIGEVLGCGAHVTALRRTFAGDLHLREAVTLEQLRDIRESGGDPASELLPVERAVARMPRVPLAPSTASRLRQGQKVAAGGGDLAGWIALYTDNEFIGVGEALGDGIVAPRRLVAMRLTESHKHIGAHVAPDMR